MTPTLCLLLVSLAYLGSATLAPLLRSESEEVVAGEYIVVFKNDIVSASAKSLTKQISTLKSFVGAENIVHEYNTAIQGFAARLTEEQLLHVRQNKLVDFVEVNAVVRVEDCASGDAGSWGQSRVTQTEIDFEGFPFKASSAAGKGVTVYVVDTGVFITHTDFEGRAKFGFKSESSWSDTDKNGHGTHVASTIAGKLYGVAKKANIVAVKVLSDGGSGSIAGVIAGVDYVAQQHKKQKGKSVANLSLGGGKAIALNNAVKAAVAEGVVFAVAAGNDNGNACNKSPASEESAITVGSTEVKNDKDVRSYFSNYGTCVNIFAPGSNIKAAWIGSETATKTISGTSMASPHVAGLSALLLGDDASLTPEDVKEKLVEVSHKDVIDLACGSNSVCSSSPNALAYNGC